MMPSVVLVTGVGRFLGARVAAVLAREPDVGRVIGVDADAPWVGGKAGGPGGFPSTAEFVEADPGDARVARLVAEAGVDTVVHASVGSEPPGDSRSTRGNNVVSTLRLLAACQRSAVRRLVVRSTTAVYGSTSCDPALFVEEDTETDLPPYGGPARDAVDIEAHVRAFARHRPDVSVLVLRMANLVGPSVPSPLTRYLRPPVVPTMLGFDPRLQFLHEQDAVEVLRLAVRGGGTFAPDVVDRPGSAASGFRADQRHRTVNVAGPGVLLLSQAIRRAGRVPLPVPGLAGPVGNALAGLVGLHPEQAGLFTLGGIADTTRLREEFGYQPRRSGVQAFDEFVRRQLSDTVSRAVASATGWAAGHLSVGEPRRSPGG